MIDSLKGETMKSFNSAYAAGSNGRKQARLNFILSTTALTTVVAFAAIPLSAFAQTAKATQTAEHEPAVVEEVVVTGSRIIREGYEAPTPLTVVGADIIAKSAESNLLNILNAMPAVSGVATTTSAATAIAPGTAGIQSLNLRSLGANRVLVLLDGQRVAGASYAGVVDVGTFPQQLIQRVDVVTGGASAVYGSDAVAGVVNFILDKKFTGVKGELSGGVTNYGDDKNYKVDLTAGFGFADNRGHVLLSGEHMFNAGIHGYHGREAWADQGITQIPNPAYTATNGLPQQIVLAHVGGYNYRGGIITSGPLKGTAFGAGGTPFQYQYGSISSATQNVGGDWQLSDTGNYFDRDPSQRSNQLFTRVSYDIADNVNVFVQYGWVENKIYNSYAPAYVNASTAAITLNNIATNAYLPASVKAAAAARGVTSIPVLGGGDLPAFANYTDRITNRLSAGLDGTVNAFDTTWHWSAAYGYSSSKNTVRNPVALNKARAALAVDAVVDPATGQIVCRSTLTNPTNGCLPYNLFGLGVNAPNSASLSWMNQGGAFQHGVVDLTTYSGSFTGEPFSLWAGPVSLALSFEHRLDTEHAAVDATGLAQGRANSNFSPIDGSNSVTEGAAETLVPLAKGLSWAQSWDLSAAVRFTSYQRSGFVTTWKVGTTFAPIDDIKFRLTRSRDIRAPNIQELLSPIASVTGTLVIDDFRNNQAIQPNLTITIGNPNLVPEKADTTGIGAVLQPSFLAGFTASVDYWDVNIGGAIQNITTQQVIDACYTGILPSACAGIARDPTTGNITTITVNPFNLAVQDTKGVDLEASYRAPLSSIVSSWNGDFSLHGLMTIYLGNYQASSFAAPSNHYGENGTSNPPNWKLNVSATYSLDPITFILTGRAFSSGTFNSENVACTSGCPTSTTAHITVDQNYLGGRFYLDANVVYNLGIESVSHAELFFSVKNMFNNSPPPRAGLSSVLYDTFGAIYRTGIRFKL